MNLGKITKPVYRGDKLIVPLIISAILYQYLGEILEFLLKEANISLKASMIPKYNAIISNTESIFSYLFLVLLLLIFIRRYFFSINIDTETYNIKYNSLSGLNYESNDIDLISVIDCDLKMSPWNLITATAKLVINSRSEERQVIERLSYLDAKKLQQEINKLAVNNYSEYRVKKDNSR